MVPVLTQIHSVSHLDPENMLRVAFADTFMSFELTGWHDWNSTSRLKNFKTFIFLGSGVGEVTVL